MENPYKANPSTASPFADAPRNNSSPFPVYCIVVFIIDLIFSFFRLLIGALSVMLAVQGTVPPHTTVGLTWVEAISAFGMAIFGFLGCGLLLAKKRAGLVFVWTKVAFAVGSLAVGVYLLTQVRGNFAPGSPEAIGFLGGAIGAVLVRLVLLLLFIVAIVKAQGYFRSEESSFSA